MKKIITSAAALFALSASAIVPAQAAGLTIWVGAAELLDVTSACAPHFPGFNADQNAPGSVYRAQLNSNEPPTTLSMIFSHLGGVVEVRRASGNAQMHGTGNLTGYGIYKDLSGPVGGPVFQGTYSFTITPATVTASTNTVTITGTIFRYGGFNGCNVTFQGAYTRQR